jgi:radical SAM superfamily enzyme YgiQ (UPF0313 family)
MKILLVEPAKHPATFGGEDVYLFEPLALEYLGAGVSDHHDVRILDQRIDDSLCETLESFRPDVVGVTAYTVHVKPAREICRQVKAWRPDTLTVVGGHHATVAPDDFDNRHIDLVVSGDGVAPLREILHHRELGRELGSIPGVAVRAGDHLVAGPPPQRSRLDDVPPPDRSLTSRYRDRYYCEWMRPLASMRTSKGCPYRCSFCAQWKVAGGRYLRRDVEAVVDELASIDEEWVFFADDESLVDVARMTALATEILAAGIRKRIFLYGRSDTIARNPDLLELWAAAGLERVFIGLEFFRDEDLRFIRKGSTTDDNQRAVEVLTQLGIDIYASFIVRPEFDHEDFRELRDYCRRLGLDFASFAVLTPLPGTDLLDQVRDRLVTTEPELFDFIHSVLPTVLPLDEFYRELFDLYRRAIPVSRQLGLLRKFRLRDLPVFLARSATASRRMRSLHLDHRPA